MHSIPLAEEDAPPSLTDPALDLSADLRGTIVAGRHELAELFFHGDHGSVYLGRDTHTGRPVEVKILASESATSAAVDRFRERSRRMLGLSHPGLAAVLGEGITENGLPFVVMEHREGRNLHHLLGDPRLAWPAPEAIVRQLAEALAALHALGVVHGNVSPGNIVWIEDEGAAPRVQLVDREFTSAAEELAAFGGLPHEPAPADDLHALGVVVYELCTGHIPTSQAPPSMHGADAQVAVPERFESVVLALVDPDPAGRPTSAVALLDLLDRATTGMHAGDLDFLAALAEPEPARFVTHPVTATPEPPPRFVAHPEAIGAPTHRFPADPDDEPSAADFFAGAVAAGHTASPLAASPEHAPVDPVAASPDHGPAGPTPTGTSDAAAASSSPEPGPHASTSAADVMSSLPGRGPAASASDASASPTTDRAADSHKHLASQPAMPRGPVSTAAHIELALRRNRGPVLVLLLCAAVLIAAIAWRLRGRDEASPETPERAPVVSPPHAVRTIPAPPEAAEVTLASGAPPPMPAVADPEPTAIIPAEPATGPTTDPTTDPTTAPVPALPDQLSAAEFRRLMLRSNRSEPVRSCYRKHARPGEDEVSVIALVTAAGRIQKPRISPEIPLADCLRKVMQKLELPAATRPAQHNFVYRHPDSL